MNSENGGWTQARWGVIVTFVSAIILPFLVYFWGRDPSFFRWLLVFIDLCVCIGFGGAALFFLIFVVDKPWLRKF